MSSCRLDIECSECPFRENYSCPEIGPGDAIKEYSYCGKYKLCVGTHGKKYDLWKYGESMKEWWLIKSGDRLDDCKA